MLLVHKDLSVINALALLNNEFKSLNFAKFKNIAVTIYRERKAHRRINE